ncbi:MAG: hypothetical protein NC212_08185 [Staphylococcus sp.]|nr:hypothetical protein [Staphylococcus sp.]
MKRYFFSLLCTLITSFCAYSQDEITVPLDNSQETSILTSDLSSGNGTNPAEVSSMVPTYTMSSDYAGNSAMAFDYKNTQEWGKYKALRAVGWSAFGVGVPATLVGLFLCGVALDASPAAGTAGAIVTISGGALTLSSIPLLISAYHYRNKAKMMALNVGVTSINAPSFSNKIDCTPALSFALNF